MLWPASARLLIHTLGRDAITFDDYMHMMVMMMGGDDDDANRDAVMLVMLMFLTTTMMATMKALKRENLVRFEGLLR